MVSLTDNEGDLELADTVANGDKLGSTPDETGLLDGTNGRLKGNHVGLVIPRLDIESNDRLEIGRKKSTCCSCKVLYTE